VELDGRLVKLALSQPSRARLYVLTEKPCAFA